MADRRHREAKWWRHCTRLLRTRPNFKAEFDAHIARLQAMCKKGKRGTAGSAYHIPDFLMAELAYNMGCRVCEIKPVPDPLSAECAVCGHVHYIGGPDIGFEPGGPKVYDVQHAGFVHVKCQKRWLREQADINNPDDTKRHGGNTRVWVRRLGPDAIGVPAALQDKAEQERIWQMHLRGERIANPTNGRHYRKKGAVRVRDHWATLEEYTEIVCAALDAWAPPGP